MATTYSNRLMILDIIKETGQVVIRYDDDWNTRLIIAKGWKFDHKDAKGILLRKGKEKRRVNFVS